MVAPANNFLTSYILTVRYSIMEGSKCPENLWYITIKIFSCAPTSGWPLPPMTHCRVLASQTKSARSTRCQKNADFMKRQTQLTDELFSSLLTYRSSHARNQNSKRNVSSNLCSASFMLWRPSSDLPWLNLNLLLSRLRVFGWISFCSFLLKDWAEAQMENLTARTLRQ